MQQIIVFLLLSVSSAFALFNIKFYQPYIVNGVNNSITFNPTCTESLYYSFSLAGSASVCQNVTAPGSTLRSVQVVTSADASTAIVSFCNQNGCNECGSPNNFMSSTGSFACSSYSYANGTAYASVIDYLPSFGSFSLTPGMLYSHSLQFVLTPLSSVQQRHSQHLFYQQQLPDTQLLCFCSRHCGLQQHYCMLSGTRVESVWIFFLPEPSNNVINVHNIVDLL